MATYPAIASTTNAIRLILDNALATSEFAATTDVELHQSLQLQKAVEGVQSKLSIYLYRVALSSVRRHIGPTVTETGDLLRPAIPLDLYYLITAWAADPRKQHQLLGWTIRVLEDTSTIPTSLLNAHQAGRPIFRPGETVELVWQPLSLQELSDVWEVARTNQQPSASYIARMIMIEPTVPMDEGALVQTREFDYAEGPA